MMTRAVTGSRAKSALVLLTVVAAVAATLLASRLLVGREPAASSGDVAGLIRWSPSGSDARLAASVEGRLVRHSGCVLIGGMVAIWPAETGWMERREGLRLPAVGSVEFGEDVRGSGGYLSPSMIGDEDLVSPQDRARLTTCASRSGEAQVVLVNEDVFSTSR